MFFPLCLRSSIPHQETEIERSQYNTCLQELRGWSLSESNGAAGGGVVDGVDDDDEAAWMELEAQETALLRQISLLRDERKSLKVETKRLQRESARMDQMEQKLFDEYHAFGLELNHASSEHAALQQQVWEVFFTLFDFTNGGSNHTL